MGHRTDLTLAAALSAALWAVSLASPADGADPVIVSPKAASFAETLAAAEVRRYVYLRTGRLCEIRDNAPRMPAGAAVLVARKDRPILGDAVKDAELKARLAGLKAQGYLLKTLRRAGGPVVLVVGGDDRGVLYGAYRLAEHLGVRFYLHGDVVPDHPCELRLPQLDERGEPLFPTRGIQPFHDFPEGPDWWEPDTYKAVLSQLPKLRMNFFGLHTYPEGGVGPEPTVWIGQPADVGEGVAVKFSYPSSYFNTLRGNWGYAAKKTGDYAFGADRLFEHDAYGGEVMADLCPHPKTPQDSNELFGRVGGLLRGAFRHAHSLGIQTCVGTETPLHVPRLVRERLGGKLTDAEIRKIYEGMFRRIMSAYPLDYYWFWTPEGWTWGGAKQSQVDATVKDLRLAIAAAKAVKAPFTLATCGWVLGPPQNRALFDEILPKDMPMSCINRQVGKSPVEPGFARVKGRPKWAIPWMEDDPALCNAQLWVGRMRKDAFDSFQYGCTGLMGIHWRTRVLGPNVSALAKAAWDQEPWGKQQAKPAPRKAGPIGGLHAKFPQNPIAETDDDPLYQTVRYDVGAYHLAMPNGTYTVVLKFCEPHYKKAGARVFGVKLQGKTVIDRLDLFAKVGQNKALDYTFKDVVVAEKWLDIGFIHQVEFPCIAAISVEGPAGRKKINCGGPAYKDYAADWPPAGPGTAPGRFLPTGDFYRDWAASQFGPEVAQPTAALFERLDGRLPRPTDWVHGPGGMKPDNAPWETVAKSYAFVDELAALRPKVKGAGNLERFDFWLNQFRYMKAASQIRCTWARYNKAVAGVKARKDPQARKKLAEQTALPIRRELLRQVGQAHALLLSTVSTPGGMGNVANWAQHILPGLLTRPGGELSKLLGRPLPADAVPDKRYAGPPRIIVPTVRTSISRGERLVLKVIVLADQPAREAAVYWRPMGRGEVAKVPLQHVARGVYRAALPAEATRADLEYYIRAVTARGRELHFPATAPKLNQTVIVTPVVQEDR